MTALLLLVGTAIIGVGILFGHWLSTLIWRVLLDALRADRDAWKALALERQTTMDGMRQDGFMLQKAATVTEGADPEAAGLARAEAQLIQRRDDAHFIQRAKTDLMRRNPRLTEREALAEAVKLRRSVTDEDSPT